MQRPALPAGVVIKRLPGPFLSKEDAERIRAIGELHKPPAMDEFVERELGGSTTIAEHDECLVCNAFTLRVYEQPLFRGPYGRQAVCGQNDPAYVRVEIRQECSRCGVKFWKIPPETYAKF